MGGELTQLSTSCVSQTQSQAAAESRYCLLNIIVESSTSRSGKSVVEESVVASSKTSYSPVLNQGSRLIVRVIVFGTVLYCSAL